MDSVYRSDLNRRLILSLGTLALIACGSEPTEETEGALPGPRQEAKQNVLLIIADDVGVDSVSTYGQGQRPPSMPTLDTLAQRGIRFTNAWSNPLCSPTRAGVYTGRHAFRTGVGSAIAGPQSAVLRTSETTIAEVLTASGYEAALFGKWHLGSEQGAADGPNVAGWSHFSGSVEGALPNYFVWPKVVNGTRRASTRYATTENVDDALEWIEGANGPWMVTVAFNAGHYPFHVPPSDLHDYTFTNRRCASTRDTDNKCYRAMVQAMDREMGRLVATLQARGQMENTTIIFMGDNGTPSQVSEAPFSPTHAKATVYEGGVRVPFVVAGPIVKAGGRTVDHLVQTLDIFAAVADIAGIELPAPVGPEQTRDSISFVPYLADPAAEPLRDTLYTETFTSAPIEGSRAIRNTRFKLVQVGGADELYDLAADRFETTDLLDGNLNAEEQAAYDGLKASMNALLATGSVSVPSTQRGGR